MLLRILYKRYRYPPKAPWGPGVFLWGTKPRGCGPLSPYVLHSSDLAYLFSSLCSPIAYTLLLLLMAPENKARDPSTRSAPRAERPKSSRRTSSTVRRTEIVINVYDLLPVRDHPVAIPTLS